MTATSQSSRARTNGGSLAIAKVAWKRPGAAAAYHLDAELPVFWTNTKYRMRYMNMGHGDKIYSDAKQNQLIAQALLWLGNRN